MYLNDAFDRAIDARERPERPIPAGLVTAREVFAIGFALLAAGVALLSFAGGWRAPVVIAGLVLAGAIVLYDAWHKGNPFSVLLMGACRVLVYLCAALASRGAIDATLPSAGALGAWVVGLSYAARYEAQGRLRWTPAGAWPLVLLVAPLVLGAVRAAQGNPLAWIAVAALAAWLVYALRLLRRGAIPKAVAALITGIALVDALASLTAGHPFAALACACAFAATLLFHRAIPGT
jgi:4-hydroxybenzoate polyprenyltransferase